ncbi:MAG: DUF1552 domain-containing protein [Planctomycetes bacterium]|nr:DUF1552 domain-containing protein [Planctomycetota bacterium]
MNKTKTMLRSRRAFLRGAGVTLALPWLETLAAKRPRCRQRPPLRMAIVVTANGMLPSAWKPEADDGEGWQPSFTLQPLRARRHQVSVLTGLANRQSFDGDGHYAKVAPLLTGNKIRRTGGRDLHNGVSMDQVAAAALAGQTLLPSLELGCDPVYPVEDMGYSSVYGGHISWAAPDRPLPKEIAPRKVFDRLFRSQALARDPARASVLDAVRRDSRRLAARLSQRDRHKLEEYEAAVRDLELRIEAATAPTANADGGAPATGVPQDYPTHLGLMFDLIALAFRTDATRVITFLTANEVSGRNFAFVDGCAGNFHEFSHHQGTAEKQEPYRRINRWHVDRFATLLDRLAAIEEGEGTLLDSSMVVLAAAMSDGNAHSPHDLPVLLAGGSAAGLRPGRLIGSPADTPLCSLWLSLLQRLGVDADRFGDAAVPLL